MSGMSDAKKEKVFDERLAIPCSGKRGWPMLMAVSEGADGRDKYVNVHEEAEEQKLAKENPMMNLGKPKPKTNYKQMGAEVKSNALDACRYFIQGHRKMLLGAIMNN